MVTRVTPRAQVAFEPGRRGVVVLEQRRIAVDRRVEALAQDQIGVPGREVGVKFGAGRALDAVDRPEHLRAVGHVEDAEGRGTGVVGGEGGMIGRVPVLGEDADAKLGHQRIDAGDDHVALGDGQRATGTEVVLDVDHDNGFVGSAHGFPPFSYG